MSIKSLLKRNRLILLLHRAYQAYKQGYNSAVFYNDNGFSKVYYYIKSGDTISGFFAEYRRLIDALAYADHFGFVPYVVYNKEYLYAENERYLGTDNPFEYYFEQVDPEFDEKTNSFMLFEEKHREYIYRDILDRNVTTQYAMTDEQQEAYFVRAIDIIQKYIRFNKRTDEYLKSEIQRKLGDKRTLGVHARGGEWRTITIKGHPVAITLEEHIRDTKKVFEENHFEQIFLATDEKDAIKAFEQEFGSSVVYFDDVVRGESGEVLAFSSNERPHHKYLMGLEVLRDAETLVHCSGLIAGLSNISQYCQMKKRAIGERYDFLLIENNGIHKDGIASFDASHQPTILKDKNN